METEKMEKGCGFLKGVMVTRVSGSKFERKDGTKSGNYRVMLNNGCRISSFMDGPLFPILRKLRVGDIIDVTFTGVSGDSYDRDAATQSGADAGRETVVTVELVGVAIVGGEVSPGSICPDFLSGREEAELGESQKKAAAPPPPPAPLAPPVPGAATAPVTADDQSDQY
jgi:hypothetical protein